VWQARKSRKLVHHRLQSRDFTRDGRRAFLHDARDACALVSAVYYTLDFPDGPGWLALFVATYTLTALGDGRRSLRVAAAGITVLTVCWLVAGPAAAARQPARTIEAPALLKLKMVMGVPV
jgi:hypothetical protein